MNNMQKPERHLEKIVPIKQTQTLTGDWPLNQLFNIDTTTLLSGRDIPLGKDYTGKFDKKESAIVISKRNDPYFSMNLWLRKKNVKEIEAREKIRSFPSSESSKQMGIKKGDLVEIRPSRKRAIKALRDLADRGVLKENALQILGVIGSQVKPSQTKVMVH